MKIHICGIYGCGKSTLADKLSKKLNIPKYSLDDIKYLVKYDKVRSIKERIKKIKEICRRGKWITEGTWSDFAEEAFKKADIIIFMQLPRKVCSYRVFKRYFFRDV
mgnify:FL=1